ncbi:MAG: trypsin-like serine protease [SAR202 cluster bacterium]|nr:trypsin-like serine protease [SAR202 cluster bacterium]MDP6514853.1 trypsin-like serine protease [SAR202 cluster bacterium]MDP6713774.1 trypsin-like serine protease [SAR202 cluster bacterium]
MSRILVSVLLATLFLATAVTVWADDPPPDSREAPSSKIVGGQEADVGEWPWQILMGPNFTCGGSILSSRWIVTAAHCVTSSSLVDAVPAELEVAAGIHNRSDAGQRSAPEAVLLHPNYNGGAGNGSDIALLYLPSDLTLGTSTNAQAISMITTSDSALVTPGTTSTVTGWGTTASGGTVSQKLLEVELPIVTNTTCDGVYGLIIDSMVCAGGTPSGGTDSCQGDSGGPLVVQDGGSGWKLLGVVSFGTGCADPNVPGVYTRVSSFATDINTLTGNGRPLSVISVSDKTQVNPGDTMKFTVTVANLENSTATNVKLTDTLPAGFNVTSAVPDTGTCPTASGTTTQCSLGTLAPQASTKVVITATAPSVFSGQIRNNARATSDEQTWPSVGAARATTPINVSTTTDLMSGTDGVCSLREAVIAASTNSASGSVTGECPAGSALTDKIMLPLGTYTLTRSGSANDQGSLFISAGKLEIAGASTTGTIIDATALGDRAFFVQTASATISNLTVKGGQASGGGAMRIIVNATATLNQVNVTGNSSTGDAGAIRNEGALTVNDSSIAGNTSGGFGGGVYNALAGTLTISRSTVSGNTATHGAGGIESNGGNVTILNSTISGNTANGGVGGGIEHDSSSGVLSINNSTIAANVASSTNVGGGIAVTNGAVKIKNSILADNTAAGGGPDCFTNSGKSLTSEDYNLIESTSGCTITGATSNNITGQDPKLGALADNGGPTKTHALLTGSPALDKGNTTTPGSGGNACLSTDQRGMTRPSGSACDMGAYEFTVLPPSADLEVTKTDSPDPVTAGGNLTYVVTVTNKGPDMALSVEVEDNLPSGTTFVSANASQGSCGESSGTVLCNLQDLTGGATATATIVVTVDSGATGNLTNSASAASNITADPVSGNNSASATTAINSPKADLSVNKTGSPDPVTAGTDLTYTIQVTNNSSATSTNVKINDALPAGTTLVSMSASPGTCSESGGVVTCSFGDLAGGAIATATIVVKVSPTTTGSILNVATSTSQTLDDIVSNNSFKAVTQVSTAPPVPNVSPWALLVLTLALLLTFSGRLRRIVWSRLT